MSRPELKPISIVGGGLAGLTLGIGLRQRDVPVVILEQGHYPRHRVCGEFISGRGQGTLRRLGLLELLTESGALYAKTARFFSQDRGFPLHVLPQPALSVSRFKLDALLADRFKELGGDLRCGTRAPIQSSLVEGVVRASGRRAQADVDADGWRWFGVKAHAKGVALAADLEMHLANSGYVGISRLPDGKANVCGLFRRRKGQGNTALPGVPEKLRGEPGSILHERLSAARFEADSFCAVGGLSLRPQRAAWLPECCIGDTLTMIPPVTGNGMSMAFESAELALLPLAEYASGRTSWTASREAVAQKCDGAFEDRLRWARWLQKMLFYAPLRACLLPAALRWGTIWKLLFWATR